MSWYRSARGLWCACFQAYQPDNGGGCPAGPCPENTNHTTCSASVRNIIGTEETNMQAETLRERTWWERQEAKAAVVEAVRRIQAQERALDEARAAYREALKWEEEAVQRDIDAWAT